MQVQSTLDLATSPQGQANTEVFPVAFIWRSYDSARSEGIFGSSSDSGVGLRSVACARVVVTVDVALKGPGATERERERSREGSKEAERTRGG